MTLESVFRVIFLSDSAGKKTLDALVSALDTDEETPSYNRHNEYSATVFGESRRYGLDWFSGDISKIAYNEEIVTLDLTCSVLFQGESPGQQQFEETFDLVRQFYQGIDAQYVFGMHSERIETIGLPENRNGIRSPISDESLAQNRIVTPTWLMLFPPAMVEEYGREWLLDLPAERIEELDDGTIMIVATTDIFDADSDFEIANAVGEGLQPLEDAFAEKH
ncbi:hypothetical protein ACFQJ7_17160 [Halovenus rubra]|uniref:Uncharacterized protein n=2 Tax=Halovenus rubra TaxID=869890 RepID=A0ABD5XHI7_9EURY|nr:hypothetical protein [Halovenus rubra]